MKQPVKFWRGAWHVDYYDATGRHVLRFASQAEAIAYAQRVGAYGRRRTGHGPAPAGDARLTIAAYAPRWLDAIAAHLKPRALEAHEAAVALYIVPRLGTVRLAALTRRDVKDFLTSCFQAGVRGRPLKPGSVRLIKSALSALLYEAVDDELIPGNVAARLGRKFRFHPTAAERQAHVEQRVLTPDERRALFGELRGDDRRWYALFCVYDRAGLRLGEGLGLHMADVRSGTLQVRRTLDERTGDEGPPKFGPRVVALSPELAAVLKHHIANVKRALLATGVPRGPWLFPSETGGPLDPSNVRRTLRRVAALAGLGRVSPHDLRHTFGDTLARTQSPQYVQQQLGHRDVGFTIRTYASLSKAEPRDGGVAQLDVGMPRIGDIW